MFFIRGFHFKSLVLRGFSSYRFIPEFKTVAACPPTASVQAFRSERSMYSADIEFVRQYGGPLGNFLLGRVPQGYYNTAKQLGLSPNIDIRVHHFDKSFLATPGLELYPAIPGLHCDGEWRETYFSQPDLDKVPVSYHLVATIATEPGISNTQFLLNKIDFSLEKVPAEYTLWEKVDEFIRKNPNFRFSTMHDGALTLFGARSLHEATPVRFPGSRLFFRCSMWHRPKLGNGGKLSSNEQLYTVFVPRSMPTIDCQTGSVCSVPQQQVIDRVPPTIPIEVLAKETGLMCASPEFVSQHGGPIAKSLLSKVPGTFFSEAREKNLEPKIDFLVYRLYPSYQPNLPGYDRKPRLPGWHLPIAPKDTGDVPTPEIQISLSTHAKGVNNTELLMSENTVNLPRLPDEHYFWNDYNRQVAAQATTTQVVNLEDGDVTLTNSHTPRREVPTTNRGWWAMFRVSMQRTGNDYPDKIVRQQYVSMPYKGKGW